MCLHTRLTEFFLSCLLYCKVSSIMVVLEVECLSLRETSINLNKLLVVLLLPVLFILYLLYYVVAGLLLNALRLLLLVYCFYPLFYTDVVDIFLFTRWSCKQARSLFLFLKLLFIILRTPFRFS